MKFAVVGSRNITDYEYVVNILKQYEISHIVSGGANGIDSMAEQYANEHNIPTTIYKPDWKKYGRGAGFVRNKQIIDDSDCVIAIWDGVSKGTKNSIDHAKKQNKQLFIWNENAIF
jgi:hypothetical protein